MNILILGSGGREHTLAWKLTQSPLLGTLFIAPGNAGTGRTGKNLPIAVTDFNAIREAVLHHQIEMVVVGPEDPLVAGIHDYFRNDPELRDIPVIGPTRAGAMLEGSKDFAKQFMNKYGIPTARHQTFRSSDLDAAIRFLRTLAPPFVLKADGLAAGKGVIICDHLADAELQTRHLLVDAPFGEACNKLVIEEFLAGTELSVFILTDGRSYILLPEAKDYKRAGENDSGPNTGGMGSISPVPFATPGFMHRVRERVIEPTLAGLITEDIEYKGFIFFGLMNVGGDPFVIEYNCRLGDPETESVLPRIKSDLVDLFQATAGQSLHTREMVTDPRTAATVMLVSAGYPGPYEKNKQITGEEEVSGSLLFHAGTRTGDGTGNVLTSGGRVMAVTTLADTMEEALATSYRNCSRVNFEGKNYRRDIGFDLELHA